MCRPREMECRYIRAECDEDDEDDDDDDDVDDNSDGYGCGGDDDETIRN